MVPKVRMEKTRVCKTVMTDVMVPKVNMVNCKRPKVVFVDMKQTICTPKPDCASGNCDTVPIPYNPKPIACGSGDASYGTGGGAYASGGAAVISGSGGGYAAVGGYKKAAVISTGNSYGGGYSSGGAAVISSGGGYSSGGYGGGYSTGGNYGSSGGCNTGDCEPVSTGYGNSGYNSGYSGSGYDSGIAMPQPYSMAGNKDDKDNKKPKAAKKVESKK